jgi:predicted nucleic acid-binding protein
MRVVVDASVAIKWFTPELHHDIADELLNSALELHAPELVVPEFGNIIWKKVRAGMISEAYADEVLGLFLDIGITFHRQSGLLSSAYRAAAVLNQSVYDCIYLSLALELGFPLATADDKFFNAVRVTDRSNSIFHIVNFEEFFSRKGRDESFNFK